MATKAGSLLELWMSRKSNLKDDCVGQGGDGIQNGISRRPTMAMGRVEFANGIASVYDELGRRRTKRCNIIEWAA